MTSTQDRSVRRGREVTAAATYAVRMAKWKRWAAEMEANGWTCTPPEQPAPPEQ